jgi:hypothetical protein
MQRSPSWLSALATAVGRAIGVIDSGPILPVTTPPGSRGSINGEPVGFAPDRLPADKWATMAEAGTAAASVWLDITKQYPFHANPMTGAAAGAY